MKDKQHKQHNDADSTMSIHTPLSKKFREIIINASLLLVPSAIFIVVRINTVQQTIEWRWLNLLWFFLLYVALLVLFIIKPHMILIRKNTTQRYLHRVSRTIKRISSITWVQILFVFCVVAYPWAASQYQTKIIIYSLTFFIFALGINYTVGYTGMLNLGHVLPFAAGAYVYALLFEHFAISFYTGLLLGLVAGGIFGCIIALVTLRLNGDYLGIVTLAVAEIFRLVLVNWDSFTNGMRGVSGIQRPTLPFVDLSFQHKLFLLYYIALALACLGYMVSFRLERSRLGRAWESVREDDIAAKSMGVNISSVRILAFTVGGVFAGIAGVVLASSSSYVGPQVGGIQFSITVLSIVILGGMGSLRGIILGTVMVILLPEYLREFQMFRMLIFGAMLVIMMRYRPLGLIPQKRHIYPMNTSQIQR